MIPYEKKERYHIEDLIEIVRLLRSPEGCPWDKVQTHESIRSEFIEETYEVIEAIDRKEPPLLQEELGDVLLQVVFHTQIEQEQGHFTFDDVCTEICEKMVERHPHVFDTVQADTTEQVLKNWDTIKEQSKHQTTRTQTLEAVAKTLPALIRSQKVYKRAAKAELDILERSALLSQMQEAIAVLCQADPQEHTEEIARAVGTLLFCCTGIAQQDGFSAEQILVDTTKQFITRFAKAEEKSLKTDSDMNEVWEEM